MACITVRDLSPGYDAHSIVEGLNKDGTAAGTKANAYKLLIAIVIAAIIVLAMNLVGSLLISAPVGSTIVAVDDAAFAICYAAGRITGGAEK